MMNSHTPPFPFSNCHFNTIFGNNGPRKWLVSSRSGVFEEKSNDIILQCKNDIRLHGLYTPGSNPDKGMIILLHGWEGTARSIYLLSAALAFHAEGYSVFRLHMRDHGPSHHLNEDPYLAIRLDEILDALEQISALYPHDFVGLAGYSLGANVAVRVAANLGARPIRLDRVVAFSPPIDPEAAAVSIRKYKVYNRYFIAKWQKSFAKKIDLFARYQVHRDLLGHIDIMEMHEDFIPRFSDHETASSYFGAYALTEKNIRKFDIPCRIVMVEDDPIIPVEGIALLPKLEGLEIDTVAHGGHCGFVGGFGLESWADAYLLKAMSER